MEKKKLEDMTFRDLDEPIIYALEEFYTIKEVAEMLKLSIPTVYRHIYEGKLHGNKIGNSWRISKRSLFHYVTNKNKIFNQETKQYRRKNDDK